MRLSEMFEQFIENLAVPNTEQISLRYGELTASLNKAFRDSESKTDNTIQVGSYGRRTAIRGVSDLDMLYVMPRLKWEGYKSGNQLPLLQDVRDAMQARYPKTEMRVDRQVVVVTYQGFEVEVLPAFEQDDGSGFLFPDTYDGGSWPLTRPREEISAVSNLDREKNRKLRRLCKMARAWRNKHGVAMGGLLVDTLAYNFLSSRSNYDSIGYRHYGELFRDFLEYLSALPRQDYFAAPGSGQRVYVKKNFQRKARKGTKLATKAIEAGEEPSAHDKWKKVFGRPFPGRPEKFSEAEKAEQAWDDTEQFIEDMFPIDIRYALEVDCEISQDGFREGTLLEYIAKRWRLKAKKRLMFRVVQSDVPEPYRVFWKVLNRGEEAQRRNEIRGQIVSDEGYLRKQENTKFRGNHVVECYAVRNGVVVAKDRIDVPIQ